ncbi:MAG: hypothetical protein WA416_10900 [Candidatus Sulfotelmatobacter sp.]
MRTFPAELAEFRTMVKDRGARLRQLPFAELKQLTDQPAEHVMVESRKATIGNIVLPLPSGGIQVVLQGFLEHRLMPGKSVALDGFCKYPDETVSEMKAEEFWEFD